MKSLDVEDFLDVSNACESTQRIHRSDFVVGAATLLKVG